MTDESIKGLKYDMLQRSHHTAMHDQLWLKQAFYSVGGRKSVTISPLKVQGVLLAEAYQVSFPHEYRHFCLHHFCLLLL